MAQLEEANHQQLSTARRSGCVHAELSGEAVKSCSSQALRPISIRLPPTRRLFCAGCWRIADDTQVHSRMRYCEFNDIMPSIARSARMCSASTRSNMELLASLFDFKYPKRDRSRNIRHSFPAARPRLIWPRRPASGWRAIRFGST
jgi:hypothetical protein